MNFSVLILVKTRINKLNNNPIKMEIQIEIMFFKPSFNGQNTPKKTLKSIGRYKYENFSVLFILPFLPLKDMKCPSNTLLIFNSRYITVVPN